MLRLSLKLLLGWLLLLRLIWCRRLLWDGRLGLASRRLSRPSTA